MSDQQQQEQQPQQYQQYDEITITLVHNRTGLSDTIPLDGRTTTIGDVVEWSKAIFGIEDDMSNTVTITVFYDGRPLTPHYVTSTLQQLNIRTGDLLAINDEKEHEKNQRQQYQQQQQQKQKQKPDTGKRSVSSSAVAVSGNGFGGLDFSNLLQSAGVVPASVSTSSGATASTMIHTPVYYNGMNVDEAIRENPHPKQFVTLLLQKEHLLKELNYHNPKLASKFFPGMDIDTAASLWRDELVKGSISGAIKATTSLRTETIMKERLQTNPADIEAIEFFQKQESQKLINEQYHQMMEEYPEALGRVLMLYVEVTINGTPIQAFCDSGAQSTIMSKSIARMCSIDHLIDTRFAGIAVGVGTGTILGRIHIVQLTINGQYLPCSVTVMDDPPPGSQAKSMPFLLGLDMMKRHLCHIDLQAGCLRFPTAPGTDGRHSMEVPFLHEKDLAAEQGGTKDFDVVKANEEFLTTMEKEDNNNNNDDGAVVDMDTKNN